MVLPRFGIEPRMMDLDIDEPQSETLEYVSRKTADAAFGILKSPLFVEDAGLFVRSLSAFPGVFSSYVFSTVGIQGILKLLEDSSDRRASFRSIVGFTSTSIYPEVLLFKGEVSGEIARSPRGTGGFGFDPIFLPEGSDLTYAEMKSEDKNKTSHRARALDSLGSYLSSHPEIIR
ncbi:MAG TPA: RdgB/HAM1 family non-canonical purine NTP pyrophosphatase [Thermoproteota archaeon]|nr:RdgB/HAM1 family non-canonical purine NTP pyrophosphatase [Thermoproteota archaeon]